MGDFLERIESLKISVKSPNGMVVGEYSGRSGLEVRFPKALRSHDPMFVQAELDAVVSAYLEVSRQATRSMLEDGWVSEESEPDPVEEAFDKEVAAILIQMKSRRENVLVQIGGEEVLSIRLRPGITSRMDMNEARIAAEVNDTLKRAVRNRDKQLVAIYEKYFGLDWLR